MLKKIIDIIFVIILIVTFIFGVVGIIESNKTTNIVKNNTNVNSQSDLTKIQNTKEPVNENGAGNTTNQSNTENETNNSNTSSANNNGETGTNVVNTNNEEAGIKSAISTNLQQYYTAFVQAVNTGEFSGLAPYLYPNSPIYSQQENFIPSTYNQGIQEQFVSSQINGYQFENNNKTVKVAVTEVFDITYSSGTTQTKAYNWTYTFKYCNDQGSYLIYSIN
ncbi:MAG: TcaA NTF2-like domain-containing protein [Clostridium sp.]